MCISMVKQQRHALVQREAILLPLKENLQKKIFPYRSNVWFDSLHRSIQRHRESFVNPMISNSFPTVDEENENEIRDDNQVLQCDLQKFRKNSKII